jgi:phosphatidylinositol 4-phosphatase
LFWSSYPNKSWSPPVTIDSDYSKSVTASEQHFEETKNFYGQQFLVNLIDQKGDQNKLGKEFTKLHNDLGDEDLKYVWFDFHEECKKMKWENLSKLVQFCLQEINSYGSFMANFTI